MSYINFFNKLHLNTCDQPKTPQTSDSGREGEEGACARMHVAGGQQGGHSRALCLPDLSQLSREDSN